MTFKLLLIYLAIIPSVSLAQEKETSIEPNSMFAQSLLHIDADGESLSLSNDKDFLEDCCVVFDRIFSPFLRGDIAKFRALKVVEALGLDNINSLCSSSKNYGNYHIHKSFIQTTELDRGLFGLLGDPTEKYSAQSVAPSDTNFLFESKLNCASFYTTFTSLLKTMNRPISIQVEKGMNTDIPEYNMNAKKLLGKIDARIAFMAKVNLNIKSVSIEATLRAENVAILLWPGLKTEFEKDGKLKTEGNIHRYHMPNAMPGPDGMMDLYFLIDLDENLLWISTHEKHLAKCRDKKSKKLATTARYQQVVAKLPKTGATQLYLSTELIHDLIKTTAQSLNFGDKRIEPSATMSDMLFETLPTFKKGQGFAMVAHKHRTGMLFVINSPCRIRFNIVVHSLFNTVHNKLFQQ